MTLDLVDERSSIGAYREWIQLASKDLHSSEGLFLDTRYQTNRASNYKKYHGNSILFSCALLTLLAIVLQWGMICFTMSLIFFSASHFKERLTYATMLDSISPITLLMPLLYVLPSVELARMLRPFIQEHTYIDRFTQDDIALNLGGVILLSSHVLILTACTKAPDAARSIRSTAQTLCYGWTVRPVNRNHGEIDVELGYPPALRADTLTYESSGQEF